MIKMDKLKKTRYTNKSDGVTSSFSLPDFSFLKRLGTPLILLVLLLIVAVPASAQDSGGQVTDDEVNAIAKDLYCPICESTPLDVCATQACADWRQVIRDKLSEGQTEEEIKAYFLDQYGPRALAEPPQSGVTLLVWILPILVVLVGIVILYRYMSMSKSVVTVSKQVASEDIAPDVPAQPPDDDYRARIERELREIKK